MKYYNKENAYVPTGTRESVPPFGVTRDYTDEEVQKTVELRYAIQDRGYLVPWDGKTPLPRVAAGSSARKANYTMAPDNASGASKKVVTPTGQTVEYVVADTNGADDVQNAAGDPAVLASLPEKGRPADFIEAGLSGRGTDGKMKTKWTNASDAFEAELKASQDADEDGFDDDKTLTEGDDNAARPEIPDADAEIASDFSQILTAQGKMGASVTTTKDLMQTAASTAASALADAVRPDYDDGEIVAGASKEVTDFLRQKFSAKKWIVSKETNVAFLTEVQKVTQSDNLKAIATQRLAELATVKS